MEVKEYKWKEGFEKKENPEKIAIELDKIKAAHGKLTPFYVVQEAEKKGSILHNYFQWDNDKAAHLYRLQQARHLIAGIEVVVISEGKERKIRAFEVITTSEGKGYKQVAAMTNDELGQVKKAALQTFSFWKNKLSAYRDLSGVVEKLDAIISDLQPAKIKQAV